MTPAPFLLDLTPNAHLVEFTGPSTQVCMGSIKLLNTQPLKTKSIVAFRVRTNAPTLFAAKPHCGTVRAGSGVTVTFQYRPPKAGAEPALPAAPSVAAALGNNVNPAVRYKIKIMAKPTTDKEAEDALGADTSDSHGHKNSGVQFTDAEYAQNIIVEAKLYAVFQDTKTDVIKLHQHRSDFALSGAAAAASHPPAIVTTKASDQHVPGAVSANVSFTALPGSNRSVGASPSKSGDIPTAASSTPSAMKAAFPSSDDMLKPTTKSKPNLHTKSEDKAKLGVGGSKHSVKLVEPQNSKSAHNQQQQQGKQHQNHYRRKFELFKQRMRPYTMPILLGLAVLIILLTLGYSFARFFAGARRAVKPKDAMAHNNEPPPLSEEELLNQDWS